MSGGLFALLDDISVLARAAAASIDDVAALAIPVLKHRMALTFAARAEGESVAHIVRRLTERLG